MEKVDLGKLDTNPVEEHQASKVKSDGSIFVNPSTYFQKQSSRSIQTVEIPEECIKKELQEEIVNNGLDPLFGFTDDKNLLLAELESKTGVTNITDITFLMSCKENRFDEKFKANTTNIDHREQINTSHELRLVIRHHLYVRKELVDGVKNIVFQCPKCGTKTSSSFALSKHIKTEHRSTLHLCCRCSKLFMSKRALQNHNSCYHRQSKLSFKCNKCYFSTERFLHLAAHKRAMHPNRYTCNKCKYSSAYNKNLKQHHFNHHYDEMEHGSKVFISKDNHNKFIKHARVHSKKICCLLCEKIFSSQKYLDQHLIRHCKAKLHNCIKCGFGAKNISLLKRHKRAMHPTRHYCNQCSYNSAKNCSLKQHEVSNHYDDSKHGSKVYSCKYCNKKFAILSRLNAHMRGWSVSQPCSCTLCKYKSNFPRHLKLHQTCCHEPKNFSCTHCSKTFVCTESLSKHLNSRHSKYECPICSFTTSNKRLLAEHEKFQHHLKSNLCARITRQVNTHQEGFLECQEGLLKCHKPHHSGRKKIENSDSSEVFSTLKSNQIMKSQKIRRLCRKNCVKSTSKETVNSSGVSSITAQNEIFICKACNEQFSSSKVLGRHLIYCKFL